MKIEVDIPDEKIRQLAKDIMDCYPEYSSPSLQCVSWKYKDEKFKFVDVEEDKEYTVTIDDVVKAIPVFIIGVMTGKWKFYGLSSDNILELDAGNWDADVVDAVVQLVIFKDVIYG